MSNNIHTHCIHKYIPYLLNNYFTFSSSRNSQNVFLLFGLKWFVIKIIIATYIIYKCDDRLYVKFRTSI